jgi:hypothetical protein
MEPGTEITDKAPSRVISTPMTVTLKDVGVEVKREGSFASNLARKVGLGAKTKVGKEARTRKS